MEVIAKVNLILILLTLNFYSFGQCQTPIPPSNNPKFWTVLNQSKLQAPTSSPGITKLNGFANDYFQLVDDTDIQFKMSGKGRRSELRQLTSTGAEAAWNVRELHEMRAEVILPDPDSAMQEFTFMQILCETGKGFFPALRISWRRFFRNESNRVVATIRTGTGDTSNNFRKLSLFTRDSALRNYNIRVLNNKVSITIDGTVVPDQDLSFWSSSTCNFKAGVYVQSPDNLSVFAVTRFRRLSWN